MFIAGALIGSLVGCSVRDEKPSTPTASERTAALRRLSIDTPDSRTAAERLSDLRIVSQAVGRAADIQKVAFDRATTHDLERAIANLSHHESLYIRALCEWYTFERGYRGGELLSYYASAVEWLTNVLPPASLFQAHDALMATMLNASADPAFFASATDALRSELRLVFLYCMPDPGGWPAPLLQSLIRTQGSATSAPTPVAASANTPTPAPTPTAARAGTATPTPTPAPARADTAKPMPAPTPTAARAGTATPTPTPAPARADTAKPMPAPTPERTATPSSTPGAAASFAFGDGVHLVPSELAPGTYAAANTSNRCRIVYDNIYPVASGPGRVAFEVQGEWSSVSVSNCGTFEPYTPARLALFGDGVYLVPSELAPGTYAAANTSSRCRIVYDNIYPVASGPGRVAFEVQGEWSSVSVSNCGTFEPTTR